MIKFIVAFLLCSTYLVKDGVLAELSWNEAIHHAEIEHVHENYSDPHHDHHQHSEDHPNKDEHQGEDCCLITHGLILNNAHFSFTPVERILSTQFNSPLVNLTPFSLSPPIRPPIV